MNKIELIKQKIKENEEQLNKDQHILSYTSLIAINHQLRDELVDELESEIGSLIMTNGILKEVLDNQEHIENENMLLRTKLAMYEDLLDNLNFMNFRDSDLSRIEDTRNKIKLLDKKCDGACEI